MDLNILTLAQLEALHIWDQDNVTDMPHITHNTLIIYRISPTQYEVYLKEQKEESDSGPKFMGTAEQVIEFNQKYN